MSRFDSLVKIVILHSIVFGLCQMDLQNIWHNYQPILCGCSKGLYTSTKGCIDPFSYCMMSSVRSTFCWLIFRLDGTGLGLTEEVENVGDLHRGELLAVLAVTGGGELLEKVGDALDPSHQVSTGYCWSSIGKIQKS